VENFWFGKWLQLNAQPFGSGVISPGGSGWKLPGEITRPPGGVVHLTNIPFLGRVKIAKCLFYQGAAQAENNQAGICHVSILAY
jgi:hypothetical protein